MAATADDLLRALAPVAKSIARTVERRTSADPGECYSAALWGCWQAIRDWDEEKGPLQPYARQRAFGAAMDQVRSEYGRDQPKLPLLQSALNRDSAGQDWDNGWAVACGGKDRGHQRIEDRAEVAWILGLLPEQEARVLRRTFLDDRYLREVGEEMGVTEARVCQIRGAALKHARHVSRAADVTATR